jgi:vancomycin permeability regulator SanA
MVLGVVLVSLLLMNLWVLQSARRYVAPLATAPARPFVIVPGAAVWQGRPSPVFRLLSRLKWGAREVLARARAVYDVGP